MITFDDLLDLASRKGPIEITVKAMGGKTVLVRDPSSADCDEWRRWCFNNQSTGRPMAAKLVQIMLCDKDGEKVIPQTEEAFQQLADSDPRMIDEIAKACIPLVNEPSDDDLEKEKNV